MTTNVLIGIHGMLVDRHYIPQMPGYERLFRELAAREPAIATHITPDHRVWADWGQDLPDRPLRDDHKLRLAENYMHSQISTGRVEPNERLGGAGIIDHALRAAITDRVKDEIFIMGMADVLYYAGEGEKPIRAAVYGEVAQRVSQIKGKVRLHLLAHSQGATIAHDLLFGLFNPTKAPDVMQPEAMPQEDQDAFALLRKKAQSEDLTLGSLHTVGCQISLSLMRKQVLVDKLFRGQFVDPSVLGIPSDGKEVIWNNFYDRDDVLGYPLRALYGSPDTIMEYEVNTGSVVRAHTDYWLNGPVLDKVAETIAARLG